MNQHTSLFYIHNELVPDETVQLIHNRPPFGTRYSLTLDIAIALSLITVFFSFIYFTLQFIRKLGTSGRGRDCRPQRLATATTGHRSIPSFLQLQVRPKTTYTLVDYTGGNTAHFYGDLERNRRQGGGRW